MTVSPALAIYLAASWLAGAVAPLLLRRRLARGKEDAGRLGERLGRAGFARPDGDVIWLHGASVGEAMSMLPLIRALQDARPDARFLITTGTVTSANRIADLLPDSAFHQYLPVDTAGAVGRFLDHWRPDLAIWIESELWPRLVVETSRRRIPMAMINARISDTSAAGWSHVSAMARRLFGAFDLILTQEDETVERITPFASATSAGNLKALVTAEAHDQDIETAARQAGQRPIWLAASTHEGEEAVALAAHAHVRRVLPDALLILAPRHPDRADDVAIACAEADQSYVFRTAATSPDPDTAVWLADTLGEMGIWYALAPVTFVGGSLVPKGGHTPFEPIAAGSAVLHGPYVENFAPAYRALTKARAVRQTGGAEDLAEAVVALLQDPGALAAQADAARSVRARLVPDVAAIAGRLTSLMGAAR